MKLNTKKIFLTTKTTPKRRPKLTQKRKLKSPFVVNSNSHFDLKQKLFVNTNLPKENPFKKPEIYNNRLKNKKYHKMINSSKKTQIDILKSNNILEGSCINNVLLENKFESNRNEPNFEKENKDKKISKQNIDKLSNIFRNSSLRSTIIIDNKGNNNLDLEQKKIIDNYFYKTNIKFLKKTKINQIKVTKYNENNKVFTQKNYLIGVNKCKNDFSINIQKKIFNTDIKKNKTKQKIKNYLFHNKLLSNKENIMKMNAIKGELFDIISEKEKSETNSNSIFENKSIDSSFLGSSLDNDFYKILADKKTFLSNYN